MTLFDFIRARYRDRGFAVYAMVPGQVVTVEMHWPDGSLLDARGQTEAAAFEALLPGVLTAYAALFEPEETSIEDQSKDEPADPPPPDTDALFG